MKKRTRIWAILLTVLMLVGMLPLSLFSVSAAESQTAAAASGASLEESPVISAPAVTLNELKTAVEAAGSTLWWFQDFESTTDGSVTSEGKREPDILLADGSLGGYLSSGSLKVKDHRVGMTYTSVDGNRVLSWKAGTAPDSNKDQFITMGIDKTGYNMVASADLRMIGNHVISGSLFMIGSRNGSSGFISRTLVYLQGDGKLYAGSTVDPSCYLGQLSSDTFTSVAVSIDLPSNLYYVYINGVNATPDGVVFADDAYMAQLKKWFGDSFAVTQYKAESFRFYQITPTTFTNSSDIEKQFPGLYVDNLYAYGTNTPSGNAATPLVVETRPNGFATVAGMTRYYDGKGVFSTENFTAGGETYIVGNAGWVLGKQSEGVTWTPHAPYVNTTPPPALTLKKNITSGLGNHWGGTGTMGNDRNATNASANVRGDAALYVSSYATGGDSYFEINGFDTLTDTFVASVDLMLGDDYTSTADNVPLFNLLTFDNADCKNDSAKGFHRSDNWLLTVLSSGWVKGSDGNVYFRLSTTEYTRISVAVNMVAHTFDLYVNGVFVGNDIFFGKAGYKWTNAMRMMQSPTKLGSFYVDNGFVYVADKPFDALAEQPTLRNGFVDEDGVRRYYENGKPKIDTFTLGGVNYTTNSGGAVGLLVMEEGMVLSAADSVQYANVNNDQFAYQPAKGFTNWNVALSAPMDITGYDHISFDMYVPDYNGTGYGIPADFMLTIGQEERFYPATDVTVDDSGNVTACVVSGDYKTGLGLKTYGDVSTSGALTGTQSFRYKDANGNKKYDKGEAAYVRTWVYDILTSVYVDGVKTTPKYWGVAMDGITAGWHTITVKISDLTKSKAESFEKFALNTTGWSMNQGRDWCSNKDTSHSQAAAQKVAYSPIRFYTTGIMDMAGTDGIVNGCYFKDGVPQKGWITEGDKQYYADPQTYRLATGIQAIGGTWYSFGENYVCGGKLNGVYTVANSVAGAQVKTTAQKVFEDGKLVLNALTAVDGALYKTDAYGVATVGTTDGSVHFDANGRGTLGIKYNLSLYADFNVNFYMPTGITNVSFGEDEMTEGDGTVTMGGTEYEVYTVGRAANATTTAITLTVTAATADGKTASVTYTTNIVDYTMKVLAMDTVTPVEGQMMVAMLQYAQQAFVLLSEDHQPDATLTAALNHANAQKYEVPNVPGYEGETAITDGLKTVFVSAQLDLTAIPKFVFNVKDGFTGTVTISYNGKTVDRTFTGTQQNEKIEISDLRIYNFDTTFHISVGGEEIGTYNLCAYTEAVNLDAFAQALYNYIAAAKAYKTPVAG